MFFEFFLLICFFQFSFCQELLSIDETTFNQINVGLIVFGAPWCPHCQRLETQLESLIDQFDKENIQVDIGMVDCDANKKFCESKKAFGYPTIMFKK